MITLPSEAVIGVISTIALGRGSVTNGYGLVITHEKIIGAKAHRPFFPEFAAYLGPETKATESDRIKAREVADKLTAKQDFELKKSAITQIRLHLILSKVANGYLLFKTQSEEVKLTLKGNFSGENEKKELDALLLSLMAFSPDRFYDDSTGNLVVKDYYRSNYIIDVRKRITALLEKQYVIETMSDKTKFSGYLIKHRTGLFSSQKAVQINYHDVAPHWDVKSLDPTYVTFADKIKAEVTKVKPPPSDSR